MYYADDIVKDVIRKSVIGAAFMLFSVFSAYGQIVDRETVFEGKVETDLCLVETYRYLDDFEETSSRSVSVKIIPIDGNQYSRTIVLTVSSRDGERVTDYLWVTMYGDYSPISSLKMKIHEDMLTFFYDYSDTDYSFDYQSNRAMNYTQLDASVISNVRARISHKNGLVDFWVPVEWFETIRKYQRDTE